MTMARIGIERDVAHDADLRHGMLDRAHRLANEISRIMGFAAIRCAQRPVGIRKQRDGWNTEFVGFGGSLHGEVHRQALDPRHRRYGLAGILPGNDEERPDQVGGMEIMLAHQPARPVIRPISAHADRREAWFRAIRRLSGCGFVEARIERTVLVHPSNIVAAIVI